MKNLYPAVILEDFEKSCEVIINTLSMPQYLESGNCRYSPLLRETIRRSVRSIREASASGHQTAIRQTILTATGEKPEDMLMWQIDNAIQDIRAVISNADSKDSSKVSASKFLFELIQKRTEIAERIANIDRVYSIEALVKEFIEQHAESPAVAEEFLKRLSKLNEGKGS